MSRTRVLSALVAALGVALTLAVPSASAAPATPTFTTPVDAYARYDGQTGCSAVPMPGVVAFRQLLNAAYPLGVPGYDVRSCDEAGVSEHKDGRALDWMVSSSVPAQEEAAQDLFRWLLAPDAAGTPNAMLRRLGIMYMIHNNQIYKPYASPPGWYPYTGSDPHTSHVHFSFSWAGALQSTSWWTLTSAPQPGAVLSKTGLDVLQRTLPSGAPVQRTWSGSGTAASTPLTGNVVGGISTARLVDGSLVAAARGLDNNVYVNTRPPGQAWQGWVSYGGGRLTARPAIAANPAGGFDLAVRGTDGVTWISSKTADGTWVPWSSAGGAAREGTGVGIVRTTADRLELVVLGADGAPMRRVRTGTTWGSWSRFDGSAKGDVGLAAGPSGTLLTLRGQDDRAYVRTLGATSATPWTSLGGSLSSSPTVAASRDTSRVDVVAQGNDGRIYRSTTTTGTSWSPWQAVA